MTTSVFKSKFIIDNDKIAVTDGTSVTNIVVDGSMEEWVIPVQPPALPPTIVYGTYKNTGGTITTVGNYTIHTFTSNGTFTPGNSGDVEVLVVAGGGGGGGYMWGGGGGGGGVIYRASVPVTGTPINITVGAGGTGGLSNWSIPSIGGSGGNSSFGSVVATGGGGGGKYNGVAAGNGGSGGGGGGGNTWSPPGGSGIAGQGYNGGLGGYYHHNQDYGGGGGGGGASQAGWRAGPFDGYPYYHGGNGGAGIGNQIYDGTTRYYGGGGGGSMWYSGTGGTGGIGGGGNGGSPSVPNATAGVANTGGGGGGADRNGNYTGAKGGSGIVIVKCRTLTYKEVTYIYPPPPVVIPISQLIHWITNGTGAVLTRESTIIKYGSYSAKLTRVNNNCSIYQDFHNFGGLDITYWRGKSVTFSCWVCATAAGRAKIAISDGVSSGNSVYHTGTGWQYLTVKYKISNTASYARVSCNIENSNTTVYFDVASAVEELTTANYYGYLQDFLSVGNVVANLNMVLTGISTVNFYSKSTIAIPDNDNPIIVNINDGNGLVIEYRSGSYLGGSSSITIGTSKWGVAASQTYELSIYAIYDGTGIVWATSRSSILSSVDTTASTSSISYMQIEDGSSYVKDIRHFCQCVCKVTVVSDGLNNANLTGQKFRVFGYYPESGDDLLPIGTKMWFFQNSAPSGWSIVAGTTDGLIAVAGGSSYYNVSGGTTLVGSWNNLSSHTHGYSAINATTDRKGHINSAKPGRYKYSTQTSPLGSTTSSAGDSNWRPTANVGLIAVRNY